MITRVPCCSCMPSGTVTRSTFGPPSGSNNCTIATGMPFSSRPSFVMTQTCLLFVSGPLPQTFIHGEYMSCGCSPAACWPGCPAAVPPAAAAVPRAPVSSRRRRFGGPASAAGAGALDRHCHRRQPCQRPKWRSAPGPTAGPMRSDDSFALSLVLDRSRPTASERRLTNGSLRAKYGGSVTLNRCLIAEFASAIKPRMRRKCRPG